MAAFEEETQKDIQSHNDIEQLLKECEDDMRNDTEDEEVYSESESEDLSDWQHLLLCKQPSITLDGQPDFIVCLHFDK